MWFCEIFTWWCQCLLWTLLFVKSVLHYLFWARQISTELLFEKYRHWHWMKSSRTCKATFPKSFVIRALTLKSAHLYNLTGSLQFLILYKKSIPLVFLIFLTFDITSFLPIYHDAWPERCLFAGQSLFHRLSVTAVDFCMVCASACPSVL